MRYFERWSEVEKTCKEYNRAIYKKKYNLLVTQAAVYIRKIISTSAAYARHELQCSLVHSVFVTTASFLYCWS